jgi:hypothetical protein
VPPGADLRQLLALTSPHYDEAPDYGRAMSDAERRALEGATLSPCAFKQLRVEYTVTGHDSEQRTSSEERTSAGFDRNFVRYRPGFLQVLCRDDDHHHPASDVSQGAAAPKETAPGQLEVPLAPEPAPSRAVGPVPSRAVGPVPGRAVGPVPSRAVGDAAHVLAETVFPVMKIEAALYGHHTNPRRQVDVKTELEALVEAQGRQSFNLDPTMNLQKLFKVG